jgi:hypothetical protein
MYGVICIPIQHVKYIYLCSQGGPLSHLHLVLSSFLGRVTAPPEHQGSFLRLSSTPRIVFSEPLPLLRPEWFHILSRT